MSSQFLNFSDAAFPCTSAYQNRYGCNNPYLVGIVLDAVFPADITITTDRPVYSLKVAVWQSPSSFGYVKIMGKLDELPKLTSRGQIIIVGKSRGKRETNYRGHSQSIATVPPQFNKHREVLLLSFPDWEKWEGSVKQAGLVNDDNDLVVDKYSIVKGPFPADGTLKDHLGALITSFINYEDARDYCPLDPRKYVALCTLAKVTAMRSTDNEHSHELQLVYCVAVWQHKDKEDDYAVELFDISCQAMTEKYWPPEFTERYTRITQVDCYNETTPTAFVRLPKMEYSKHYWYDRDEQWKKADCLMNIRKVNIDEDGMISIVQRNTQGVSGYQGYDTIDVDSPYADELKDNYRVFARPSVRRARVERMKRKHLERRKMTPNDYDKLDKQLKVLANQN